MSWPRDQFPADGGVDRHRARVARYLERCGRRSGDKRFAHASAILRGNIGGRPAIDDAPLLAEMEMNIADDHTLSVERAARLVALTIDGRHSADAATRRLARKYRAHASHKNS